MNIAMNVMVKKGHHSVDISTYTEIICKSELLMGGGLSGRSFITGIICTTLYVNYTNVLFSVSS